MIKQIGTKVYYCNLTGNVLKIVGDMAGYVKETTFEEDYIVYKELNERENETINVIYFEYGEYFKLSANSTGVKVNLETLEVEFTYDELPEVPQEPTLEDRVDKLESALLAMLQGDTRAAEELFADAPGTLI